MASEDFTFPSPQPSIIKRITFLFGIIECISRCAKLLKRKGFVYFSAWLSQPQLWHIFRLCRRKQTQVYEIDVYSSLHSVTFWCYRLQISLGAGGCNQCYA